MRRRHVVGYGLGEAANQAAFATVSLLLLSYYTDVVAMNAAVAGLVLMVVRIVDAFFDLFAGRLMDRTSSRWGKFRPFLLAGGIALAVTSVLLFTVPDLAGGLQVAYAAGTFALFGLAFAFSQVSLGSLAAAMTQDPRERDRLAMVRSMSSFFVYLLLYAGIAPLLEDVPDQGEAYLLVVVAASVVSVVLFACSFAMTQESVSRAEPRITLRQSLAAVRANQPLLVLCGGMLLMLVGFETFNFGMLYYARYLAGGVDTFVVMSISMAIGQGLFGWLTPRISRRCGKRGTYVGAGAVAAFGYLALVFADPAQMWLVLIVLAVSASGTAVLQTVLFSLQADTVEYGQWRSGHRAEGAIYAFFSFARKGGNAAAAGLSGVILATTGYVANATVQPEGAEWGILTLVGLIPAAGFGLAAACMIFYRFSERDYQRIVAELAQSREERPWPSLKGS
ncbi:glycoside-pentoside-hexuronide (GPH):cation symporter [Nonomuraea basaltis]|uniref:glycoside-pentoside-hexuronide (GPH):cation symporter n=1 Tax=Nonomuraea basaltis TaxID=2495887 RepID=UPI00110C6437|nr:glycoside-pentoside-hexuronide (GPH):cation symporter [Nonomuraea basaltis]TMR95071.1 MFS transporter [Nonomuraea basaltis]